MPRVFSLSNLFKLFFIICMFISLVGVNHAKNIDTLHNKTVEINNFISNIDVQNNVSEKTLTNDRKVLLKYRNYLDRQIIIKEKNLSKVNNLLHFMEKRYKNDNFSDFVNAKVEENKQLNVRLEKYIKLRAIDLDELMLLKETNMQVQSALKTLSDKRVTIRNKFKFEQNNILWNSGEWKSLLQGISINFKLILSEIIIFSVVLFAYITSLLLFTLYRSKAKNTLHNKPILQNGILTSIDVFQLAYSALIYPVIVLAIYYILEFF